MKTQQTDVHSDPAPAGRPMPRGAASNHARALRATRAVTLGGLALAACGTDPTGPPADAGIDANADTTADTGVDVTPDTPLDTAPDTPLDTGVDTQPDIGPNCSDEVDDMCPDGCTVDDDADCCLAQNDDFTWCDYSPEWGCSCAVEGPFAPPSFAA